ncbi:Bardet-Biedl syndrome 10 (BBS1) protein [Novymonas esmeraldas]|uniref:Bardet-Biedl syndrome 10 (BBS1) protein n=1 Tax=Novymonas esmeraldas TaxID=1808958 RepID=A0AAW0ES72_9TRYP
MSVDASAGAVDADPTMAVLPERGLVLSEIHKLQLQLCKPKLLPIKSYSLEKLEKMEHKLAQEAKAKRDQDRVQRKTAVGWTTPNLADSSAAVHPSATASPPPASQQQQQQPAAAQRAADSPETLNSPPQVNTEEDTGADAPMSAPERTSRLDSPSDVSPSSSPPPSSTADYT